MNKNVGEKLFTFRSNVETVTLSLAVDVLAAGDLGILCSGTVTLEAALTGLPMVIFYRGSWLNALLAGLLVKIDRIGLPNIVLGGAHPVFPERIQHRASAAGLAETALGLLDDTEALAALGDATHRVRTALSGETPAARSRRRSCPSRISDEIHRGVGMGARDV